MKKNIIFLLLFFVPISIFAQTSIIIPPKKDTSGITQVYQKKRQQVVTKQKSMPKQTVTLPTKVQGICVSQVVDLGLSVKWAGWNLGANSTEQKGGYYGWGDSQGINRSTDDSQYPSATPPGTISGTQYDVARKLWGSSWRMPNAYEILELYNECKWEWITFQGVKGAKITGPNGNSIFLPASGCREGYNYDALNEECNYWSGSLDPTEPSGAFCVAVENEGNAIDREFYPEDRHLGFSVRPVYDSNMPTVDLSPEEFQQMGMANVSTNIETFKISAISSYQNGKWSNWDTSFKGIFKVDEFKDSKTRSIFIYADGVSKAIAGLLVTNWGNSQPDGNGGQSCTITCMTIDNLSEIKCTYFVPSDASSAQFICPIKGVTYSFLLE